MNKVSSMAQVNYLLKMAASTVVTLLMAKNMDKVSCSWLMTVESILATLRTRKCMVMGALRCQTVVSILENSEMASNMVTVC